MRQTENQGDRQRKYNALIIGAGGQGALADAPGSGNENKIISFGHAFKEHLGFKRVLLYDKDFKKAEKAANIWGCQWIKLKQFDPCILRSELIDIVVITTPDSTHYEILKQLVDVKHYKLRLVICEKPICTDLQQAREIVELYKAKGIPLMVNYTRRFLPYYEDLKRRYEAGEFGELIHYEALFNRGLLHTGSHLVDFLTWFFDYDLPDGLEIIGIQADYRIWQIDLFFEKYHWREERIGDMLVWDYYDKSHWYVVDNAYQFLEGKEELKCTGSDALNLLEICFELMEGK